MARTLLFAFILLLTGLFVALNWTAFMTPTSLTLGVLDIHAPIGIVMLAILAVFLLAFILWALSIQGGALMEARRMAKDLHAKSELADKAEASRFTELRTHLDGRIDQLQRSIEQQVAGLAAQFGELEDRMDRSTRPLVPIGVDQGQPPLR